MPIAHKGTPVRTWINADAATWPTVALPSGLAQNDVVLLAVSTVSGQVVSGTPANAQAGRRYAQYDDGTQDGTPDGDTDGITTLLALTMPASPPSTISIPLNAAGRGNVLAAAFTGAHQTNALGTTGDFANLNRSSGDAGTAITCPTLTPPFDGAMIIRGTQLQANVTLTPPAGAVASIGNLDTQSPTCGLAVMGAQTTAAATGTATFSWASGGYYGSGWTLALRPAPAVAAGGWTLGCIAS